MPEFEARRVPADTTEITYTGKGGRQVTVPIARKGKYAYAQPSSPDDVAALDALGYTAVARKASEAADEKEAEDTNAPANGEQEG